ncbi:hypothetical protein IV203_031336 [Nitzschia inconspicua]|uniref:Uncharacterized protein n=1 Tax=Nitzschia inconspicua TaxID=303405 RepID=A0A9K3Q2K1_9STRA|nr:hypothetical protein IV203_031336 [Nitzschia inconspicua]
MHRIVVPSTETLGEDSSKKMLNKPKFVSDKDAQSENFHKVRQLDASPLKQNKKRMSKSPPAMKGRQYTEPSIQHNVRKKRPPKGLHQNRQRNVPKMFHQSPRSPRNGRHATIFGSPPPGPRITENPLL